MRHFVFAAACSFFVALLAAPVSADPAPPASDEEPDKPLDEAAVEEVLRSVRAELLALVEREAARDEARDEASLAPEPEIVVGLPPPSLSSFAPANTPEASLVSQKDLGWLEGLTLPDFPVRWDDRLVRVLESYKHDPRALGQMRTLLARQGRYGDMMRKKLREAALPEDLVYVVMVESGYDPTARSEVGALGLWQFMSGTAGEYGLEMNHWVDERMCPEHETDAAIAFFRTLHAELGSWPLAMAAFNMGYGALLRSIQKYNTNDFWLLSKLEAGLPYETIVYVTKITAYAIIGRNPERFGIVDLTPDAPLGTDKITVPGGVGLARVARTLGVEVEVLAQLNPELKKSRVPPDVKSWELRVPSDRVARFKDNWASFVPASTHKEHVLKLGERLSDVAELYGTTVAKLHKLNDLEPGAVLRAGQRLQVPDVEAAVLEKAEKTTPATVGVPGDTFLYVDRTRVFYRISGGDSLDEIARFFHITSDEIRMWNRIAADAKLQRGMYLQLFVPEQADLTQAVVLTPDEVRTLIVGSEEFFDFHENQQNRVRLRYRVKPGDTLHTLAERFGLSIGSIARINQFSRGKKLESDSEIIVYVPEDKAKKLSLDGSTPSM